MGRYYNGDINGKFWFAVQSSTAADRFGVKGTCPDELNYYFDIGDLPKVNSELEKIKSTLGNYLDKLDKFFDKNNGYNNEILMKEFGINNDTVKNLLLEYADYKLGIEIRDCIYAKDQCHFTAEL